MRNALKPSMLTSNVRALRTSSALYRAAFISLAIAMAPGGNAHAVSGVNFDQGSGTHAKIDATTDVTTTYTDRTVASFAEMNVAAGHTWRIDQTKGAGSLFVGKQYAGRTDILGNLLSNGKVVLINPNGVFFGAGSTVNVPSLVASTADLNASALDQGKLKLDRAGNPNAVIENQGTITAAEKGLVAFVAPTVINNGIIQAKAGTVKLAAGETMTVDMYGDDLYSFAVGKGGKNVTNNGTISAEGGTVMLTANAAKDVVSNAVNNTGIIEASSARSVGGTIVIDGGEGNVRIGGKLKASGTKGGSVTVTGKNIQLAGADIDASGKTAGGNVRIGGDYQGGGTLAHADTVTADAATKINVSAIESGNGGTAVIWSDKSTQFAASASASAGAAGGNGGLVEVSSKGLLNYTGRTIARGINGGKNGKLLLDPIDVVIDAAMALATEASLNADTDVTITSAGVGADIGNITNTAYISWTGLGTLTLDAINDIIINNSIVASAVGIDGTQGGLILKAGNNLSATSSTIETARGDITVNAKDVTLTSSSVTAKTGEIHINNTGSFSSNTANSVRNDGTGSGSVHINQTDAGSIQNAVSAIGTTGWGGAQVTLAAGTWNEQVYIDQGNFVLTGQGDSTIIRAPSVMNSYTSVSGFTGTPVVYGTNGFDIDVTNLQIDGLGLADAGVAINNGGFSQLTSLLISNTGVGIGLDNVTNANVSNNRVFNSSIVGIGAINSTKANITFNHVGNSAFGKLGLGGIYVTSRLPIENTVISNNYVWSVEKGNGITLQNSLGINEIGSNRVDSVKQDSINVSNSSNLIMFKNELLNAERDGIHLENISNLDAQHNSISNVNRDGINALNLTVTQVDGLSKDTSIQNNTVYNTGRSAMTLDTVQNALVKANKLYSGSGYGILASNLTTVTDSTDAANPFNRNIFADNLIYWFREDGINVQHSQNVKAQNNEIYGLGGDGIYAFNLTVSNEGEGNLSEAAWTNEFSENKIYYLGGHGVHLQCIENADVKENTVHDLSGHGIFGQDLYVTNTDNNYRFSYVGKNTVYGVGDDGIHIEGIQQASIDGNTVYNATNNGIYVKNGSLKALPEEGYPEEGFIYKVEKFITKKGNGDFDKSYVGSNNVSNVSRDGIFLEGMNNVEVVSNIVTNIAQAGISVVNTANSSVRLNSVDGAETGLLFVYSHSADVLNNSVTGGFIGANFLSSNNALITGNTFDKNTLGIVLENSALARIEGGSITAPADNGGTGLTIRGLSNDTIVKDVAFNGGEVGILLQGPSASMQFESNGSTFTGQNYYFILQDGAMVGGEIDASQQTFDGIRAANFTEEQLAAAEDGRTSDRDDDASIGNVFYKFFETVVPTPAPAIVDLSVLDDFQNNIRNRYRRGNFSYAGRAINVVADPIEPGAFGAANFTNLSLLNNSPAGIASQLSALTPEAGSANPVNTAQDLANLSPAAGGNQPEQYASLSPAAGGNGVAGGCGNNFLDGGYENNFSCSTNQQ